MAGLKSLAGIAKSLRAMGRQARGDIDGLRAEIRREQAHLRALETAPVDDREIERRVDLLIGYGANAARSGNGFAAIASATAWSENAVWSSLDRIKPYEMLALVSPATLRTALIAEAKAASRDFSTHPAISDSERAAERDATLERIRKLEIREQAAILALAEAGLIVERRKDASPDVVAMNADQLEKLGG